MTRHAVARGRAIREHPDSGGEVIGKKIPAFERVLEIAVAAAGEAGLGYVGADVVVDARRGPVLLELNARPGLVIQLANCAGLRPRLDAVDAHLGRSRGEGERRLPLAQRVALGRELAGSSVRGTGRDRGIERLPWSAEPS
jgi:hypothetical protein